MEVVAQWLWIWRMLDIIRRGIVGLRHGNRNGDGLESRRSSESGIPTRQLICRLRMEIYRRLRVHMELSLWLRWVITTRSVMERRLIRLLPVQLISAELVLVLVGSMDVSSR